MKTKMVVGFMFNEKETDVLLIEKNKPTWQRGKFNGIGGKCNEGESYLDAMCREFKEETGIDNKSWWQVVAIGDNEDWEVMVFAAKSDDVFDFKTMEEEKVNLLPLIDLDKYEIIDNLTWLIPMCLDVIHGQVGYGIINPFAIDNYTTKPSPGESVKAISAEEIVEENFKGLKDLIEDKDLLDWYKRLIVTCMEEYHSQFTPADNHTGEGEWKKETPTDVIDGIKRLTAKLIAEGPEACRRFLKDADII